jgi:hypothetical protein
LVRKGIRPARTGYPLTLDPTSYTSLLHLVPGDQLPGQRPCSTVKLSDYVVLGGDGGADGGAGADQRKSVFLIFLVPGHPFG